MERRQPAPGAVVSEGVIRARWPGQGTHGPSPWHLEALDGRFTAIVAERAGCLVPRSLIGDRQRRSGGRERHGVVTGLMIRRHLFDDVAVGGIDQGIAGRIETVDGDERGVRALSNESSPTPSVVA